MNYTLPKNRCEIDVKAQLLPETLKVEGLAEL